MRHSPGQIQRRRRESHAPLGGEPEKKNTVLAELGVGGLFSVESFGQ